MAISWVRHAPGKKLYVRVWKDDPFKDEYFGSEWPEEFELYEGEHQGAGSTLQEMWVMNPDERSYGFIGDDIVLRTPGAIDKLEAEARDWFIAYPNDTFQRNRLPTHFCVGGKLTNVLGWLVPNGIKHGYMDLPLLNVGLNTGLLRYCPDVVFQHKHFLLGESERDDTYSIMYKENGELAESAWVKSDHARLEQFYAGPFKEDITRVLRALIREFEDMDQWEREDMEALNA